MFINPILNSYLTSKFGWRKIDKKDGKGLVDDWHQGVDLARQPNTNVEVQAAAAGEVIRVGPLGTYGNIVLIKHNINGLHYETNYAHLKSYNVKKGDKVKQGQKIGIMGNTGVGTGPHLHFEIHKGPWVTGQKNAIDPAKFIKFYTQSELSKAQREAEEKAKKEKEEALKRMKQVSIDTLAKEMATLEKEMKAEIKKAEQDGRFTSTHDVDSYDKETLINFFLIAYNRRNNGTKEAPKTHKVVKGDTLSAIALKYSTTVKAIQTLNGLGNKTVISIGQVLKIN